MTQDEYKLFTGETVTYSEEDWDILVDIASGRLASYLCLESLPSTLPNDLKLLLANFMCSVFTHQGSEGSVASKSVRNFSITFQSNIARNAYQSILAQYPDIISKYSACGESLKVESSARRCHCERF